MTLEVLSISQLYPGKGALTEGIFIHQRLRHLPESVRMRVWRVRPRFPWLRDRPRPPHEEIDGISVDDVPFFYFPGLWKGRDGAFLLRALRRRKPPRVDVVDAHFAYPTGWAAVRWGRERGLPVVLTMRGTEVPYSQDPRRRPRIVEAVCEADRVIAVSGSLRDLAVELGASPDRGHVVGNGLATSLARPGDRSAARQALGLPQHAKTLLTVGGLTERKGVGRVLDVLPGLLGAFPDLVYLVAGGGGPEGDEASALRRRVREGNLEGHVRFLGAVPHHELPVIYHAADVSVLATRNEGWANALHESIACGVPAVATDVGGNREVLQDGRAGLLVPFGDAQALSDALRRALEGAVDGAEAAAVGGSRPWVKVGEETARILAAAANKTSP
jgi:teichuronic acid biosynthesis glycosyltransferase TuaC